MAALDFPPSPTVGQIYTANGKTWMWDGVTWSASIGIGGGALTVIGRVVCTAGQASIDFTSIPNTFYDLEIEFLGRDASASISEVAQRIKINGDGTAANYTDSQLVQGIFNTAQASFIAATTDGAVFGGIPGIQNNANAMGAARITIPNYAGSVLPKVVISNYLDYCYSTGIRTDSAQIGFTYLPLTPINSISLISKGAGWAAGTVATLYGKGGTNAANSTSYGTMSTLHETIFAGMPIQSFTNNVPGVLNGVTWTPQIAAGGAAAIVATGLQLNCPSSGESRMSANAQAGPIIGAARWRRGRWAMWGRIASYNFGSVTSGYIDVMNVTAIYPQHGGCARRSKNTQGAVNTAQGSCVAAYWWNGTEYGVKQLGGDVADDVLVIYARSPYDWDYYHGVWAGGWPAFESLTLGGSVMMRSGTTIFTTPIGDYNVWTMSTGVGGGNTLVTVVDRFRITTWD